MNQCRHESGIAFVRDREGNTGEPEFWHLWENNHLISAGRTAFP